MHSDHLSVASGYLVDLLYAHGTSHFGVMALLHGRCHIACVPCLYTALQVSKGMFKEAQSLRAISTIKAALVAFRSGAAFVPGAVHVPASRSGVGVRSLSFTGTTSQGAGQASPSRQSPVKPSDKAPQV